MTFKCLECGHIFEEGEEGVYYECGTFWGARYENKVTCCPLCNGEYEGTVDCRICGSQQLKDDLTCGVCYECIANCYDDVSLCYEIGKKSDERIEINSFLATMLKKEEIEEILYNALLKKANESKVDCSSYIDGDEFWFAEKLIEEVKK